MNLEMKVKVKCYWWEEAQKKQETQILTLVQKISLHSQMNPISNRTKNINE
jgi:hypothetical protein